MSRYRIMGIVNVTPDSFSDGGDFLNRDKAIEHALTLADLGADILDIGGESTRPGAETVPVAEEYARVVPVIEALAKATERQISIDTRKPEIARAAIHAGAHIWNDVSALTFSEKSISVAAELQAEVVLMHAQGTPENMQDNPVYENVVDDVAGYLRARVTACIDAGLPAEKIVVDPGIGFGKSLDHNLALMASLSALKKLGCRVLLGASRKSFIHKLDSGAGASSRIGGSLAALLVGAEQNVDIFRVHDVAETRQALAVYSAIKSVNC